MPKSATVNEHDSTFVINDIELAIPPTAISIRKNAKNWTWQTLRTKNATKVKSGHGTIDIDVTATIVGTQNINERLIPLIAQLKATPICFIENQYIREDIQPRGGKSMAFIMKNMSVTVRPELVDTVVVNFSFGWFNYLPYAKSFEFKRDIFDPVPVTLPAQSVAWRKFYFPELKKYIPVSDELKSSIEFIYNRYQVGPSPETSDPVTNQKAIIDGLRETLEDATKDLNAIKAGQNNEEASEVVEQILSLQQQIKAQNSSSSGNFVPTKFRYKINQKTENGKKRPDPVLWRETNRVSANEDTDLTCVGITVSFENIVACLPVIGHQYMTYQHIGSIDPVVVVNLMATSDQARTAVTRMWSDIEQNALKFRYIPQQFLNVIINNDLINALVTGQEDVPGRPRLFITDSMHDNTIPGQPGTYALTLALRATNYNLKTEQLDQEFVTDNTLRNKIFESLNNLVRAGFRGGGFGIKIRGKHIKIVFEPKLGNTPGNEQLYFNLKEYAEILTRFANKYRHEFELSFSSIGNRPLIAARRWFSTLPDREQDTRALVPIRKALDNIFKTTTLDPDYEVFQTLKNHNRFSDPSLTLSELLSELAQADRDFALSEDSADVSIDSITNDLLAESIAFVDKITLDGTLDSPQFKEAKELANKVGAFQGKQAYIDFQNLNSVADSENISVLDVEPDFYFYNSSIDKLEDLVDPGLIEIAAERARDLYINTSPAEEQGFATRISNFVERNYIQSLTGTLKEQVVNDWQNVIDDDGEGKSKIGSFIKDNRMPNIAASSVDGDEYHNATANGLSVNSYAVRDTKDTNGYYYSHMYSNKEIPVKSGRKPLPHYGSFEKVLSEIGETAGVLSEVKAFGLFQRPVDGVVTSPFGPRNARNPKASANHRGVDYRAAIGTPIRAAADGKIYRIGWEDPGDQGKGFGYRIWIKHAEHFTVYAHLTPNSEAINPHAAQPRKFQVGDTVKAGDTIALSGASGAATYVNKKGDTISGPHLHFEIRTLGNQFLDPEKIFKNQAPRDTSSGEGFRFGNSLFTRSLEQFQDDLVAGQALRMNRAYPTFKLYFIEEDNLTERRFGFDDFFSYSAVKSIRNIRSRKIPADLCVIELTNVSGVLSNRKFREDDNVIESNDRSVRRRTEKPRRDSGEETRESWDPRDVNTRDENPIASLMLQEGTKVELRLGYSNDPDKLETTFVGQIVEVEFSETDDLVTIVCQSYATELAQNIKGLSQPEVRDNGWFVHRDNATTHRILTDMMHQPEVVHFGRWIRSRKRGGPSNINRSILNNRFEFNPKPQDDNIFAPPDYHLTASGPITTAVKTNIRNRLITAAFGPLGFFVGLFADPVLNDMLGEKIDLRYYIYKTTIWDIFKEMELRHPECISSPVPYHDLQQGPRMTMFFGIPNQLYFARDPSLKERTEIEVLRKTVEENSSEIDGTLRQFLDPNTAPDAAQKQLIRNGLGGIIPDVNLLGNATVGLIENALNGRKARLRDRYIKHIQKRLAIRNKSVRPFRRYHILTSDNHIVANNIRASALDVVNTISVGYFKGSDKLKNIPSRIQDVQPPQDVFRLKVDAALPDEKVQETFIQYPSCEGKTMAKHYALSQLKRELKEIYKGDLVILGNPGIKPYDVCYVFDEYTDMVGPVEVEQVVHVFSQETGFVTEIKPDLCVTVNEWTTLGTMDVVGLMAENTLRNVFKLDIRRKEDKEKVQKIGTITLGVSLPLLAPAQPTLLAGGLLGAFMLNKVVELSQFRHPYTFSPLLYKGRPYMAGVASKAIPSNWWNDAKNWVKEGVEGFTHSVEDLTDSLTIAPRGDLLRSFYGDSGPQF